MDSIDSCKTLSEITRRRLEAYQMQIANGDNYQGVLVGIYEKKTHFVYELLQNADDALATEVRFELNDNELIFYHNGTKDFSIKDIIAITGVGNSTKKNTPNVGKFGIGFKSVFAITDTPHIYNRAYNFRIENLSIPYEISASDLNGYTTKIVLPFKKEKYIDEISKELEGLDCATIMFLNNISQICLNNCGAVSEISLNRKELNGYEIIQDLASGKNYFLFRDKKTKVSFSFLIIDNKIVPLSDVYLYSFLPTRIRSELSFYVDAPFDLATTRESIEFDSEKNISILDEISRFFRDVLIQLKNDGYIDQSFLNDLLPVDSEMCERSRIYNRLYNELIDIFEKEEILPTNDGIFVRASNCALPLTQFMSKLSRYYKPWLNIDYQNSKIRNFLTNELDVKEVNIYDFSLYLTESGELRKKNTDWLIDYYAYCAIHCNTFREYSWFESEADKLKTLPIIKTRTGRLACAYINGKPQVFRYSKGIPNSKAISGLFTSKKLTEEQKDRLRDFLNKLEIKERSPRQLIESNILQNWEELEYSEKKKAFFEISEIYNSSSASDKKEIVTLLKKEKLFPTIQSQKRTWVCGEGLMRGTKEQKIVFKKASFLQQNYWIDHIEIDKHNNKTQKGTKDLCLALGIVESLPVITTEDESYRDRNDIEPETVAKYSIDLEHYPRWWYSKLNTINGFNQTISKINNAEKTIALIKMLALLPKEKIEDELAGGSQSGRKAYSWRLLPASFIRQLNGAAWLYVDGKLERTREISKDNFIAKYNLSGNEPFLSKLDFKTRFADIASDEEVRAIMAFEGLNEDQKKEAEDFIRELKAKERRKNTVSDETIETKPISDLYPKLKPEELVKEDISRNEFSHEDSFSGGINKHESTSVNQAKSNNNNQRRSVITNNKKELGDAAEECIVKLLKMGFSDCEINWFGGNNQGYDISISKNGEDIKYIEVKTVTKDNGHIIITPSEWRFSKLNNNYDIYIVEADTGKYRIISNPFKQYIDGKIDIEVNGISY